MTQVICPSSDAVGECFYFVNAQMRAPDGKTLTGVNRLSACQPALFRLLAAP